LQQENNYNLNFIQKTSPEISSGLFKTLKGQKKRTLPEKGPYTNHLINHTQVSLRITAKFLITSLLGAGIFA